MAGRLVSVATRSTHRAPSHAPPSPDVLSRQVYERAAIAAWLEARDTAPLTGAVLPMKMLIPNVPLRSLIREWRERQHGRAD